MKSITNGQLRLKINDGQFENQYVMYAGSKNEDIKQMAIVTGKFFDFFFSVTNFQKFKKKMKVFEKSKTIF